GGWALLCESDEWGLRSEDADGETRCGVVAECVSGGAGDKGVSDGEGRAARRGAFLAGETGGVTGWWAGPADRGRGLSRCELLGDVGEAAEAGAGGVDGDGGGVRGEICGARLTNNGISGKTDRYSAIVLDSGDRN